MTDKRGNKPKRLRVSTLTSEQKCVTEMCRLYKMARHGEITTNDLTIQELKGSTFIPEGSSADPLADPGLPLPQSVSSSWGEERDRDKRWADHVRQIERDGQRFDPDKKTDAGWC